MFAKRSLAAWMFCLLACCLLACPKPPPKVFVLADKYQPTYSPNAQAALEEALAIVNSQGAAPGTTALLEVAERFPKTEGAQKALWEVGHLAYSRGDYALARAAMSRFLPGAGTPPEEVEAKRIWGMSALHLYAAEEAEALLRPLLPQLSTEHRTEAEMALARAGAGRKAENPLVLAANAWAKEPNERSYQTLMDELELNSNMDTIWNASTQLSTSHAAWPLLQWKLGKLYWHVGERSKAKESLVLLTQKAPSSPFAHRAQEWLRRMERMAQTNPKKVGVLLPLSGNSHAVGKDARRGLELAFKGSGVELLILDNQGDAALTGQQVQQLAEEQVIAIVGPMLGEDSRRAAHVAEGLQIPLLTLSRADDITLLGGYVFRNMLTAKAQTRALLEWSKRERGAKSAAVLYPDIPFGREMLEAFWEAAQSEGIQIRGAERYAHDQTTFSNEAKRLVGRFFLEERADYTQEATRIRQEATTDFARRKALEKLRSSLAPIVEFDVLFIPDEWRRVGLIAPALAVEDVITNACDAKDLERLRKANKGKTLKAVTLIGPSTWTSRKGQSGLPELLERGGKFVICSVYVSAFYEDSQRKATREFAKAYKDRYGHENRTPNWVEAIAFDTGLLLRAALATGAPTREALRRALMEAKIEGAAGTQGFDAQREARREWFFLQLDSTGIQEIQRKAES